MAENDDIRVEIAVLAQRLEGLRETMDDMQELLQRLYAEFHSNHDAVVALGIKTTEHERRLGVLERAERSHTIESRVVQGLLGLGYVLGQLL